VNTEVLLLLHVMLATAAMYHMPPFTMLREEESVVTLKEDIRAEVKEEKQIQRGARCKCMRVVGMQAQSRHLKENKYEDPITGWYCDMCAEMVGP